MSNCRAAGTRKPNSHRLIVFLLLAFGFTPVLMAQAPPRTIHVFVALADNKNQGIVPVAAIFGNGDDPQQQQGPDLYAFWLKIFPIRWGGGKRLFAEGSIPAAFKLTKNTESRAAPRATSSRG